MNENMKKCPICAEEILKDAKKCKFCKEDISISKVKKPNKGLMKKCPSCKEEIKKDANKCKHCGEIQDTLESKKQIQQQQQESAKQEIKKNWVNALSTIGGLGLVWIYFKYFW
tara:strand:- start:66 stop:404 length:339 start_codon:yes stop_codon:yes gene_type:complete